VWSRSTDPATHRGAAPVPFEQLREVPGTLAPWDAELIVHLSEAQHQRSVSGDLLEIGTWHGRTSVLLGSLADEGEELQVCDLFETPPPTQAGRRELELGGEDSICGRDEFEATYERFHAKPPVIHECSSEELNEAELGPNFRFVHIDGSHLYETVLHDLALARSILTKGGIVAVDDIINLGHLGVAAAVWNDALADGVKPFACTPAKIYATLDEEDAETYASVVAEVTLDAGNELRENVVSGTRILATWSPPPTLRERVVGRARRTLRSVVPWGVVFGHAAVGL
jgi:hypothetical protein